MSDESAATPPTRRTDVEGATGAARRTDVEGATGPARRMMLMGAGGVGAVAGLAACGSGTTATSASTAASQAASQAASAASAAASGAGSKVSSAVSGLVKKAEIPVGGGKVVGEVVITQPTEGDFKAFSAKCPHQGCIVSKVESKQITCACHNSVFDAATGARVSGPATTGLTPKQLTVNADGVQIS